MVDTVVVYWIVKKDYCISMIQSKDPRGNLFDAFQWQKIGRFITWVLSSSVKGTCRGIKIVDNYRTDLESMIYLRAFIFHPEIHADKGTEKKG